MPLTVVTMTGADDKTNPKDLIDLSRKYPFVEWGILHCPERVGEPRYPTEPWVKNLIAEIEVAGMLPQEKPTLALHLCGNEANRDFINEEPLFPWLAKAYKFRARYPAFYVMFPRVQMNFNAKKDPIAASDVKLACQKHPFQSVITQDNFDNLELSQKVEEPNHQILFDESGGTGRIASHWPRAYKSPFCGYAGGIQLEGLFVTLANTYKASGGLPYWIDVESGVRTGDVFDLAKCEAILAEVARRKWVFK